MIEKIKQLANEIEMLRGDLHDRCDKLGKLLTELEEQLQGTQFDDSSTPPSK